MARPRVDGEEMRARLLEAAETLLKANGGCKLVLSDIASALGMAQSNAYRYFRTKDELVAALARRWFADVERAAEAAVAMATGPEEKIRGWLLATMREKVRRFDEDPEIFLSYLELAKGYPEVVAGHVEQLRAMIDRAVLEIVGEARLAQAMGLLEDATILFRNPYLIAHHRERVTEGRAREVLDAVFAQFRRTARANSGPAA
jgi:AcrR family transcriptional regulator